MAASTIDDAAITRLLTNCRAALATGVMTKLNGKDLELVISLCERATTSDLSGSLADQAAQDPSDGRPAIS
jgi:hypothetical protein